MVARGRSMQAAPPGAMLAVLLSDAELGPWLPETIQIAAINAPDRCVVSGPVQAIKELAARFSASGIHTRRLPGTAGISQPPDGPGRRAVSGLYAECGTENTRVATGSLNVTGDRIHAGSGNDGPNYYAQQLRSPGWQLAANVRRAHESLRRAVFLEVRPRRHADATLPPAPDLFPISCIPSCLPARVRCHGRAFGFAACRWTGCGLLIAAPE